MDDLLGDVAMAPLEMPYSAENIRAFFEREGLESWFGPFIWFAKGVILGFADDKAIKIAQNRIRSEGESLNVYRAVNASGSVIYYAKEPIAGVVFA